MTSSIAKCSKYLIITGIIALVLIGPAIPVESPRIRMKPPSPESNRAYSYNIQASPFEITKNTDFQDYAQYGTGLESYPYVIQLLNISSEDVCVRISNTTAHFVIQDCVFNSNYTAWGEAAITLSNVANGRIERCRFESGPHAIAAEQATQMRFILNEFGVNRVAIAIHDSADSIISDNVQFGNLLNYPIHAENSHRIRISGNVFERVGSEGMRISSCTDCDVENNTVRVTSSDTYTLHGLGLRDSFDCRVVNNFVQGFAVGIEVRDGRGHIVSENEIQACTRGVRMISNDSRVIGNEISTYYEGVQARSSYDCEVRGNFIHTIWSDSLGVNVAGGARIYVIYNLIQRSFKGIRLQGTRNDVINSNEIVNCTTGISLEEVSFFDVPYGPPVDCELNDNVLVGCSFSFDLYSSTGFSHVMERNTINGEAFGYFYNRTSELVDGQDFGQIILVDCFDVTLENTRLEGQSTAISVFFSEKVEIDSPTLRNNEIGVHIRGSREIILNSVRCENNEIAVNIETSESCYIYRTTICQNFYGILLEESERCTIYDCLISENHLSAVLVGADESVIENNAIFDNDYGLHLLRSDNCYVVGNHLMNNTSTGILINRASDENLVYRNHIGYNGINALCYGDMNQFDDGVGLGNYWSGMSYLDKIYEIDDDDADRFARVLPGSTTTTTEVVENEEEYSLLNDPLLTILIAVSACGVTLLFLRAKKLL